MQLSGFFRKKVQIAPMGLANQGYKFQIQIYVQYNAKCANVSCFLNEARGEKVNGTEIKSYRCPPPKPIVGLKHQTDY